MAQNGLMHANCLFIKGQHRRAFEVYREIALGERNAIAASNLGYMYHRGIAVMRDYALAREFYFAASEEDGGAALFNLALMNLRGQGGAVNFAEARKLMQRSARRGCADARLYLGLAYLLGCMYDPVEIECVSLIPFYRVIYRDAVVPMLSGEGYNLLMEDRRFEAIECDPDEAFFMYQAAVTEHRDDPYAERQSAAANFMVAKFYIEGVGDRYDPRLGYRIMERTAMLDGSREAAQFLLDNRAVARVYKVDTERIEKLLACNYFRFVTGNLGTPRAHRVPLLVPENLQ